MAKRPSQQSLDKWTKQKWRTKSGKPSGETGERYLPEKAIKSLSSAEYAATTRAKREGTAKGKQFVKQPESIAEKTRKFRAAQGGLAMMYGKGKEDKKGMGMAKGGMTKGKKKVAMAKGGMAKTTKSRPDAQTTRNMQADINRRMVDRLKMSAGASSGIREGMSYGRFPGTAGDRIQTERENKQRRAGASNPATQKRTPKK